jgi:hypothetical protein
MLNPKLYRLLQRRFGNDNVIIVNEDLPMEGRYLRRAYEKQSGAQGSRIRLDDVLQSGEEYRVNCPECRETRHRLYINHRWGVFDERSNSRNLWLMNCWNSNCMSEYTVQREQYEVTCDTLLFELKEEDLLPAPEHKLEARDIEMPGSMWRLDDMKNRTPQHKAIQFIESRNLDPRYLAEKFDVGFCVESNIAMARRRIVAPVWCNNQLIGWQARHVGKPPKGVAKWFTCKGFKVGQTFYNFENMVKHRTVVIVEGPADVWAFGLQAGAVFGSIVSKLHVSLLADSLAPGSTVVILLDPVYTSVADRRSDKPHPIERAYEVLNDHPKLAGRVLRVYLPEPYDPGELDRWYMRNFIEWQAKKQGIPVDFSAAARVSA